MKTLIAFALPFILLLSGCESGLNKKQMVNVMASCEAEHGKYFDAYADCIKTIYLKEGSLPNGRSTKAFFLELDEIKNSYSEGKISHHIAKSLAHDAYMTTMDKNLINE
jgi:hypothetical protein